MLTESPGMVMIFTVDIAGNGAPDRHLAGARGDGQKPAAWDHELEDLAQGHAGLYR